MKNFCLLNKDFEINGQKSVWFRYYIPGIFIVLLILLLLGLGIEESFIFTFVFPLFALLTIIASPFMRIMIIKEFYSQGRVEFNEGGIDIEDWDLQISDEEIKEVIFQFSPLLGNGYNSYSLGLPFFVAEIHFFTKEEENYRVKVLIENRKQQNFIKGLLKRWYRSGIKITEHYLILDLDHRTILMEPIHKKKYKEIQELKKELNID